PYKGSARTTWFTDVSSFKGTLVFFEAPHRIARTLEDMAKVLGYRPIVVARELTKVHQEFLRGTASELARRATEPRGEYTVVVGPADKQPTDSELTVSDAGLESEFRQITESAGTSRRAAVAALAKKYDRPARDVYAAI